MSALLGLPDAESENDAILLERPYLPTNQHGATSQKIWIPIKYFAKQHKPIGLRNKGALCFGWNTQQFLNFIAFSFRILNFSTLKSTNLQLNTRFYGGKKEIHHFEATASTRTAPEEDAEEHKLISNEGSKGGLEDITK
jgi:hypothetical protein